ncbi:MAG: AmmeMemoRadiSam system protein B [Pseudomonadota bacterium]
MKTRPAAVEGLFYPQDKLELFEQVQTLLNQAQQEKAKQQVKNPGNNNSSAPVVALIVPHAGYIYSGLTAAFAYQEIIAQKQHIQRVILLGPAHRVAFDGMAAPDASFFSTPLGLIAIDTQEIQRLVAANQLLLSNQAHQQEHSIEVQLPFLQNILNDFKLLPIVVGQCHSESVSTLLQHYLNQPGNLVIISTDLSHFLDYPTAQLQDLETSTKIMHFKHNKLQHSDACGRIALAGLIHQAQEKQLIIKQLDIRNSGDTAGDKQRVVGYGAWSLYDHH